ncbi:TetR family transcriptional regulator C-terminal domain-containing protein [Delftia sp. ASV31]|uniref:TetR family transcriptional regulator C-terminal domain-containing protein n=1 Tax=Delftia sp. ASV31 TaxID=2795113 RepID=UPI0018EBA6A7|nr:hypothetical protein [Delftia sp. ASV31]
MFTATERLRAYARLFAKTFENDRRICVCGMLGAETDALPEGIRAEVGKSFKLSAAWLESVIAQGQGAGELRPEQPASNLSALWLGALEGSMLVGRGLGGYQSPDAIAETLMASWKK